MVGTRGIRIVKEKEKSPTLCTSAIFFILIFTACLTPARGASTYGLFLGALILAPGAFTLAPGALMFAPGALTLAGAGAFAPAASLAGGQATVVETAIGGHCGICDLTTRSFFTHSTP